MEDEDGDNGIKKNQKKTKKLTVAHFVKEYSKVRETVHGRSAKRERLLEVYGRT